MNRGVIMTVEQAQIRGESANTRVIEARIVIWLFPGVRLGGGGRLANCHDMMSNCVLECEAVQSNDEFVQRRMIWSRFKFQWAMSLTCDWTPGKSFR